MTLLWLSLHLDYYFSPELDGNLGKTELENERCYEMPCVLAQAFGTGAGRLCISPATWAHVCGAHMLPLPSETGEGALASHEEAFWSLSNVSFPPGDLLSTKWQCPQVMHYSAATWGPQMCCASSSQDVLCPGDMAPVLGLVLFQRIWLKRAGANTMIWLELEASLSKILPFLILARALEENNIFLQFSLKLLQHMDVFRDRKKDHQAL